MPTLRTANGIDAADIVGRCPQHIVAALPIGRADRMDRREIQHVESHVADCRQPLDDTGERAMPRGIIRGRPRKHLVPTGKSGLRPINVERDGRHMLRPECPIVRDAHELGRRLVEQQCHLCDGIERRQPRHCIRQSRLRCLRRVLRCRLQHAATFFDLQLQVLPSRVLGGKIVAERCPDIPPCLDGEAMPADALWRKACFPAIVGHQVH